MVGKKRSARVASNISSATSLSASVSTHQANASAIEKAAFAPASLQLDWFASVIQGLHGHQLRVHDTSSGKLQCLYDTSAARISSLDWGYYGQGTQDRPQSRKRKRRSEETNGETVAAGEVVVAFGTNQSEIQLYSPANAKLITSLRGGHTSGVKDFKFTNYGLGGHGWSLGGDKKLVQWNLSDQVALRSIEVPVSPPGTLVSFPSAVLVASHDTFLVDLTSDESTSKVGNGANPVHTIIANNAPDGPSLPNQFLTAFEGERQILVHDISGDDPVTLTLNASAEVESVAIPPTPATEGKTRKQALRPHAVAAMTKRGELELFADPFNFEAANKGADLKAKVKSRTRRPKATLTISYAGKHTTPLPLAAAGFYDDYLMFAYVENGGHVAFEKVRWRNAETNELLLDGAIELSTTKTVLGVERADKAGVKLLGKSQVDESHAVVSYNNANGAESMAVDRTEPIDISSGSEDESDSDIDEDLPNGANPEDTVMGEPGDDAGPQDGVDEDADGEEPTFGELLQTQGPTTVDVTATLAAEPGQSVVPYERDSMRLQSGLSLGNVLSQALRTNDGSLLESCFHEQDLHVVRATIERLDSSLATSLLQKLAEKLHSRPGRAGSLMVWVQWTLIAHGGYLGSQPDTVKRLASLQRVVKERANSLQPLLNLKGKLDMLEAQMNLRRSMLTRADPGSPEAEEEPTVVYVEGQDDSDADSLASSDSSNEREDGSEDDEEDEDGPDAEASDASSSDLDGLVDIEASETDDSDEGGPEEEVDYEDVDSADEASDDADGPSVRSKLPNGIRK